MKKIGLLIIMTLLLLHSCNKLSIEPEKYVVITIDDAPNFPVNTEKMLNVLAKYDVKATFFCIGSSLRNEPELAKRIVTENILANHTMTHPHLSITKNFSFEVFISQYVCDSINIANEMPTNTYFRPPYGDLPEDKLKILNDTKTETVMWDISAEDWNPDISVDYIYNYIFETINNTEIPIILFHLSDNSIIGLDRVLKEFSNKGIKCITLDERKRLLTK